MTEPEDETERETTVQERYVEPGFTAAMLDEIPDDDEF
jgi:hypothetical protein